MPSPPKKRFYRTTGLRALVLALLLCSLAIFHERCLQSILFIVANLSGNSLCPECRTDVRNLKIVSYKPNQFSIQAELTLHTKRKNSTLLRIKNLRAELNLAKILSNFTLPVNFYLESASLDLNKLNGSNLMANAGIFKFFGGERTFVQPKLVSIQDSSVRNGDDVYDLTLQANEAAEFGSCKVVLSQGGRHSTVSIVNAREADARQMHVSIDSLPAMLIGKLVGFRDENQGQATTDSSGTISGDLKLNAADSKSSAKRLEGSFSYNEPDRLATVRHGERSVAIQSFKVIQPSRKKLDGHATPTAMARHDELRIQKPDLFFIANFDNQGNASINKLSFSLPNSDETLNITGQVKSFKHGLASKASLSLSLASEKLNLDFLKFFCRLGSPTNSKAWCLRSIKGGELLSVKGSVSAENILSEQADGLAVSLTSQFQNLDLKYSESFQPINNLKGNLTLSEKTLTFDIAGGRMAETELSSGSTVRIVFDDPNLPLIIRTKAIGPIKDFVDFISPDSQRLLEERKIGIKDAHGTSAAAVDIDIPLAKEVSLANMRLNVNAKMNDMRMSAFETFDLHGNLVLTIADHLLVIKGEPSINGIKTEFKWETQLKEGQEFDNRLLVKASLTGNEGSKSFFDEKIMLHGSAPTQVLYVNKGTSEKITLSSSLTDAAVNVPIIDVTKERGKKATLNVSMQNKDKTYPPISIQAPTREITGVPRPATRSSISSDAGGNDKADGWRIEGVFLSQADEINITSAADLSSNLSTIINLDTDISSKRNNLKINLADAATEYKLSITGTSIAPSNAQLFQFMNPKSVSLNKKMSIAIQVDKAFLSNDITLQDISGSLSCYKNKCSKDILRMKIVGANKRASSMKIYHEGGAFIIQTFDAGALLKGLNFYQDLAGGNITIKLYPPTQSSAKSPQPAKQSSTGLRGEVHMTDFKALKTPLLARLILLTPFTQIVEQLSGSKLIRFKTFDGSFNIKGKVLHIDKSVANGDLMTVTIQGTADLEQQTLSLKGMLIPNSLFNKIMETIKDKRVAPEDAKLGTNYEINGPIDKPQISVSPISFLISLLTKPLSIV